MLKDISSRTVKLQFEKIGSDRLNADHLLLHGKAAPDFPPPRSSAGATGADD